MLISLIAFLAVISPLFAFFNISFIRSIYDAGKGDSHSKEWHFRQGLIWAAIFIFSFYLDYRVAIVWPFYHWIIFDGILNKYTFKYIGDSRPFFYVGKNSGSKIDTWLSTMTYPERNAAVMKIFFLVLSITWPFVFKFGVYLYHLIF